MADEGWWSALVRELLRSAARRSTQRVIGIDGKNCYQGCGGPLQIWRFDVRAIRNFRDLEAWRIAMETATVTYRFTAALPDSERYGLVSQMRRAATSVPSNVAEGQARKSAKAFLYFVGIALGSTAELDTQLELCIRLRYVRQEATVELRGLLESLQRLLYGLRRAQKRQIAVSLAGSTALFLLAFSVLA